MVHWCQRVGPWKTRRSGRQPRTAQSGSTRSGCPSRPVLLSSPRPARPSTAVMQGGFPAPAEVPTVPTGSRRVDAAGVREVRTLATLSPHLTAAAFGMRRRRTAQALGPAGEVRGGEHAQQPAPAGDGMTRAVVTMGCKAPFKDIVERRVRWKVGALTVPEGDGRVSGAVSEADLLPEEEFRDGGRDRFTQPHRATGLAKAGAVSADVALVGCDDGRVAEPKDLARVRPAHVRLLAGDACGPDLPERAGALASDLVVAVTGRDEDNLVIGLLAKRRFGVERVAARVNEAENAWLFDQRWGVDVAVPAATPLLSLIEEATGATDTVALLRLGRAGVEVVETAITERSRAAGRALGEIALPAGTVAATVVRGGRPAVPGPGLRLLPGAGLLLVSHEATEQEIHAVFR